MHLPVPYAQFAGNNLVHNADQIMNSHVEESICSRSALSVTEGGDDERLVTGRTEVGCTLDNSALSQGRRLADTFPREAWH